MMESNYAPPSGEREYVKAVEDPVRLQALRAAHHLWAYRES